MNIQLRLLQKDSLVDKENHFALEKSVAVLNEIQYENETYEKSWETSFSDNRIWYAIEQMPRAVYCGECAVKNISDEIPEIEIELMRKKQGKGIGYQAILIMLNNLAQEYGKKNYQAKVEPDNYISQYLFEKMDAQPMGIVRDFVIADKRINRFVDEHKDLIDENMEALAKKFGVEAEQLLTNHLVYKINVDDLNKKNEKLRKSPENNHRERIDCERKLTRAKYVDFLMETLEFYMKLKDNINDTDIITEVINRRKEDLDRIYRIGFEKVFYKYGNTE